jgi:hypothetical protein
MKPETDQFSVAVDTKALRGLWLILADEDV